MLSKASRFVVSYRTEPPAVAAGVPRLAARPSLPEDQCKHEDQEDEEHDASSDVDPGSKNEHVHCLGGLRCTLFHTDRRRAGMRAHGRSHEYLDGGMLIETGDLQRSPDRL
jgi:hypothetical protein